jgi:hypothetical protein
VIDKDVIRTDGGGLGVTAGGGAAPAALRIAGGCMMCITVPGWIGGWCSGGGADDCTQGCACASSASVQLPGPWPVACSPHLQAWLKQAGRGCSSTAPSSPAAPHSSPLPVRPCMTAWSAALLPVHPVCSCLGLPSLVCLTHMQKSHTRAISGSRACMHLRTHTHTLSHIQPHPHKHSLLLSRAATRT